MVDDAPASETELDARVRVLQAVADPTRLAVLDRLAACGDRCHCDLESDLGVPANRMSFHLRVLREAGLVTAVRIGRRASYRLVDDALVRLTACLPGGTSVTSPSARHAGSAPG